MFSVDKRIHFHQCDPFGIIFYGQYFSLFSETTEDWFRAHYRHTFAELLQHHDIAFPIVHVDCTFQAQVRVDDVVTMRLAVRHVGNSSAKLAIDVLKGGEACVQAVLTVVSASVSGKRAVPFPPDVRAHFERFREEAQAAGQSA